VGNLHNSEVERADLATDLFYSCEQGVKVLERESTHDRSWGWVARKATSLGGHRNGFGADGNYQGYGGTENAFIGEGYFPRPITDGDDEWDISRWRGLSSTTPGTSWSRWISTWVCAMIIL
jgi:hypothetical protein